MNSLSYFFSPLKKTKAIYGKSVFLVDLIVFKLTFPTVVSAHFVRLFELTHLFKRIPIVLLFQIPVRGEWKTRRLLRSHRQAYG